MAQKSKSGFSSPLIASLLDEYDALVEIERAHNQTLPEPVSTPIPSAAAVIHQVIHEIDARRSIWKNGKEPEPLDWFFEQLDGSPLTPRQYSVFAQTRMLTGFSWINPHRVLQEFVLEWGKGSGKGYTMSKLACYVAYVMNCLAVDPASYITSESTKLARGTKLDMVNVAPNEHLALNVYFAYLKRWMAHPLIQQFSPEILTKGIQFYPAGERAKAQHERRPPDPFLAIHSLHSRQSGLDGFNLCFWCMDEADDFLSTELKDNAEGIHTIFRSTANTRMGAGWTGVAISYPRTEEGFMKRLAERALSDIEAFGDQAIYFHDIAATWDVRPSVSREDRQIAEDYKNDPAEAMAKYECRPMAVIQAFFDFPDLITKAVDTDRQPCAVIEIETHEEAISGLHYIRAKVEQVIRVPGYTYFLGCDGGAVKDAFTCCVCHIDSNADGYAWICPDCAREAPELMASGDYERQKPNTRVEVRADGTGQPICPVCYVAAGGYAGSAAQGTVTVVGWYKRGGRDESTIYDAQGKPYNVGHIYEDLLIQVTPKRKTRPNEVDAPVHFPSMQSVCRDLIKGLQVETSGFDQWQTIEMRQGLLADPGGDIQEISFSGPAQYLRARVAKQILHAGLWHSLPNPARDKEWRQLQRLNGTKIDHPKGGSKDMYDSEAICIFLAATYKSGQIGVDFM